MVLFLWGYLTRKSLSSPGVEGSHGSIWVLREEQNRTIKHVPSQSLYFISGAEKWTCARWLHRGKESPPFQTPAHPVIQWRKHESWKNDESWSFFRNKYIGLYTYCEMKKRPKEHTSWNVSLNSVNNVFAAQNQANTSSFRLCNGHDHCFWLRCDNDF